MKTFLFLLVLLAGAAAGYEYFQHTQEVASYVDQRSRYGPSIAKLKAENKALVDEQAALTKKLTDLQAQESQLKAELSSGDSTAPAPPAPAQ